MRVDGSVVTVELSVADSGAGTGCSVSSTRGSGSCILKKKKKFKERTELERNGDVLKSASRTKPLDLHCACFSTSLQQGGAGLVPEKSSKELHINEKDVLESATMPWT